MIFLKKRHMKRLISERNDLQAKLDSSRNIARALRPGITFARTTLEAMIAVELEIESIDDQLLELGFAKNESLDLINALMRKEK